MSKVWETVIGYVSVPFILLHLAVGMMLMIATIFMGIPDQSGIELHPLVGFLVFMTALIAWNLAALCTLGWIFSETIWFTDPPAADFRLTFVGFVKRFSIAVCGWILVFGLLALVPATRSVMIAPLALVGEPAVPILKPMVHDANPRVRKSAMEVLAWIGPPARPTAPEIARHLQDDNEQVRFAARAALRTLDPQLLP